MWRTSDDAASMSRNLKSIRFVSSRMVGVVSFLAAAGCTRHGHIDLWSHGWLLLPTQPVTPILRVWAPEPQVQVLEDCDALLALLDVAVGDAVRVSRDHRVALLANACEGEARGALLSRADGMTRLAAEYERHLRHSFDK